MNREKVYKHADGLTGFFLLLIPFVISFSSAAVMVVSILMIVAFAVKRIAGRDFSFKKTPVKWPFLLLTAISLVSIFKTVSLRASLQGMWKLAYFGSLFTVVCEEITGRKYAKRIVISAMLGLLFSSLNGIWQLQFGWDFFRHRAYAIQADMGLPRINSAFPHTNIFAAYLVSVIPLAAAMLIYSWKNGIVRRLTYALLMIVSLFCLAFTFARGAAVGLIAALVLIGLARRNKSVFIFLMCMFIIGVICMPAGIRDWSSKADSVQDILLNPERIGDYRNALNMIRHNPLLGVGVNTYILHIDKYKIRDGSIYIGNAGYAHNIYLHMWGEIGIFGLIAFLWLVFSLFQYAWSRYRYLKDDFLKMAALGITGGILAFLINGLTETVLYYPKVAVLFWFEVGVLLGILNLKEAQGE